MTPAELRAVIDGHQAAERRRWERAAWMVSHMYAPHMKKGKKPPSPDKLLGRLKASGGSKTRRIEE
jgi:hypothetical protein